LQSGFAFKSNDYKVDGIPLVRISNITKNNEIDLSDCVYVMENEIYSPFVIHKGDLLIAMSGATTGKNGVYTFESLSYLNQRVGNLQIIDKNIVLDKYRNYFIQFVAEDIFNIAYGGAQPNISPKLIGNLNIPIPPFAEQQRIVDKIESLFLKLDEAKELAQVALDQFEKRKAAILHKAFTGELTRKWREERGLLIEDWENKTLNDVASYKKGPFGSSITKAMFVPKSHNTYKVYEQGNAIRKTIDYGNYYISKEKYGELKGFSVVPGDIIISCAGTIGEIYKLPENCEEGVINQALMRVRINNNVAERFFIYYFGEMLNDDISSKSKGTAIKNIPPFAVMKVISIKLPSLLEQQEITRILDNLLEKEGQSKELIDIIDKINLMKKSILARSFRGKLGTNNPNEYLKLD
jgi:Restriction endonuclease S subunits